MDIVNAVIGIDPGKSGGISFIRLDGTQSYAIKMPETEKDIIEQLKELQTLGKLVCYIEQVGTRPASGFKNGKPLKQGIASSGKFMRGYGFLRGAVQALDIKLEQVRPQTWQKSLGCLSGGDKNITKAKAQQLFPNLKITHATADSLLIAEFGRRNEILTYKYAKELEAMSERPSQEMK